MNKRKKRFYKAAALAMAVALFSGNTVSAMRIQYNVTALNSYRNLSNNQSILTKNLENISSGYRIDRAGDDAAGLAIAEQMRAQITGLEIVQKKQADGIGLIQTADGALVEVQSMLNRMLELATQSAGDVSDADRTEWHREMTALQKEINRIADGTSYNGMTLLNGSSVSADETAALLAEQESISQVTIQGEKVKDPLSGSSTCELRVAGVTPMGDSYSEKLKLSGGDLAEQTYIFSAGDLENEGVAVYGVSDGEDQVNAVVLVKDARGNVSVDNQMVVSKDRIVSNLSFGVSVVQTDETVDFVNDGTTILVSCDRATGDVQELYGMVKAGEQLLTLDDMYIEADGKPVSEIEIALDETVRLDAVLYLEEEKEQEEDSTAAEKERMLQLLDAANGRSVAKNTEENTSVTLLDMHCDALGISDLNIQNRSDAEAAIKKLETAIDYMSGCRTNLGAVQNRLEHSMNNLSGQPGNIAVEEDRIRDVDMAQEMLAYTRNNILIQSAQAMLEQANTVSQSVLQLLQ